MKSFVRIGGILLAVLALLCIAVVLLLPPLLQRPEVQQRISLAAKKSLGRDLRWESLEVAVFPPALELSGVELLPARDEEILRAERIALRVALLPLLRRTVMVDALEVSGLRAEVVRTANGFVLPVTFSKSNDEERTESVEDPETPKANAAVVLRRIELRDVALRLRDQSLETPASFDLWLQDAELEGSLLSQDAVSFSATGTLASGGGFEAQGSGSLSGRWSINLRVEQLALEALSPWVSDVVLAGQADVALDARGVDLEPQGFSLVFEGESLQMARGEMEILGDGHLEWAPEVDSQGVLEGELLVDLTRATVRQGEVLQKPSGDSLRIRGPLRWSDAEGWKLQSQLSLPKVVAALGIQSDARTRIRLDAPLFEVSSLTRWLPALADQDVRGRVGFEGWTATLEPLSLGGGLRLEGIEIPLEQSREKMRISGMLKGQGTAIEGSALSVAIAEQPLSLDLRIQQLDVSPRLGLRVNGNALDSARLLRAFGASSDAISGPLDFQASVQVPFAGTGEALDRATGTASWSMAPGRIQGVSLLKSTFDAFGQAGEIALLAGQIFGGSRLQRFYGDQFDRAQSNMRLNGGVLRTDDLTIDYRNYRAELAGSVKLEDLSLDLSGRLILFEKIDQVLAEGTQESPVAEAPVVKRVLPLARVTGTVDKPRVTLTRAAMLGFVRIYADRRNRLGRWKEKVDRELGEGSGDAVVDILEGLLGGSKKGEP